MGQHDIIYSKRFEKKVFYGTTVKDAYLKACKWYASNIIANDKLQGVQVQYTKDQQHNSVTLQLYASLPQHEVVAQHCACCEEMHHSFFINQENDCNRCNMLGFQRRMENKLQQKVGHCRTQLSDE